MTPAGDRGTGAGVRPARWTVGRLLTAGFVLAVAGLIAVSSLSYLQIGTLARDRAPVEHTYRVLDQLNDLRGLLEDAETGQRGYLLTGQESYLEPYHQALARIDPGTAALGRLTADDPRQRAAVARLQAPVRDKLAELAQTVDLRRTQGFAAAQAVVATNRGARDMSSIRALLDGIQREQDRLLARRLSVSAARAAHTRALIGWGSLLAALIVGAGAWVVTRNLTVPVRRVTAAAERISAGDLSATADVSSPRELAQMAAAVNASVQVVTRARDEAVSATAAKSAFLATMSHEIRTPLNAVIGMTEMLLDSDLDDGQRELAGIVRDSGDSLLGIINDILDFSKIEAGELELDDHPFTLQECVEGALALVAVAADAKGLELVADLDDSCPELLRGDPTRLHQILVNLLSNAVKFTTSGEVVLTASAQQLSGRPDGPVLLRIAVADTGIGIPADRLHRLFQSFTQADSSTTRVYGGTGLGLAISRRLAEAMGGDVEVASETGVGSTFTLTAVLAAYSDRRQIDTREEAVLLSGRSALAVDGNAIVRRVLRRQLQRWGMSCTAAESPARALALLATGHTFDVVILDVHLPDPDAGRLTDTLRRLDIPMIVLTHLQSRLEPDRQPAGAATLTKPVKAAALRSRLLAVLMPVEAALMEVETAGGRRRPDAPGWDTEPLRILLAEDNVTNQRVAQLLLTKLGHEVDTVGNGREAVAAVQRGAYDVVLMDIQMPEMDGLMATRQIRAELPTHRQPRIVAMTASVLVDDRAACRRAGMDSYLPKPVRQQELIAVLASVRRPVIGQEQLVPAGPPREAAIRRRVAEIGGPGTDEEMLGQLLQSFLGRSTNSLDLLEHAIDRGDTGEIEYLAHNLKGSALNLGADALGLICQELEAKGRSGQLDAAEQILQRARLELAAVSGVLAVLAGERPGRGG